jgi:hypothetical protein
LKTLCIKDLKVQLFSMPWWLKRCYSSFGDKEPGWRGNCLMTMQLLGRYLTLDEFCTCTWTYRKYANHIDPYPSNLDETIPALEALCRYVVDPVIDEFGRDRFQLIPNPDSIPLK